MPSDPWVWRSGTIAPQVLRDLQRASLVPIPEGARWFRCDDPSAQTYGIALSDPNKVVPWNEAVRWWRVNRLREAGLMDLFQKSYLVHWLNHVLEPDDIPLMPVIWRSALQFFDTPYSRILLDLPPLTGSALPMGQYQTDDL